MISRPSKPSTAGVCTRKRQRVAGGPWAWTLLTVALVLSAGCSSLQRSDSLVSAITPYRMEIVQGNIVTREQAALVRPGMTRAQVRDILGSPLLTSAFHADRWDYVYRFQPGRGEIQQRVLTVFFQDNKLLRVAGDVVAEDPGKAEVPKAASQVIDIPGTAAAGTEDKK